MEDISSMGSILPPHVFDAMVHKAFASPIRRQILLTIEKKQKYLSQIAEDVGKKPQTIDFHLKILVELDLVETTWIEGKKYFSIKDKNILAFLKDQNPMIPHFQSKPPHEIVSEAMNKIDRKLESIGSRLTEIEKRLKITKR
jgi:DNA-binding transcriptional ArsR family regulator